MRPQTTTQVVYRGHDNSAELRLTRYDGRRFAPVDLSGVTRMVLCMPEAKPDPYVFDSDAVPGTLTWAGAPGVVTLNLRDYDIPTGVYVVSLVAYSAEWPNGYVLIDSRPSALADLTFVEFRTVIGSGVLPPPIPGPATSAVEIRFDGDLVTDSVSSINFAGDVEVTTTGDGEVTVTVTGGGGSAGVSSFNGRTGAVSLAGTDVTTALAYTPADAASLSAVALSGNYSDLLGLPVFSAVALSGAYSDLSGKPFIPSSPGDIGAATAAQGALADTAVQPGALSAQLDLKVDKVAGYGLSQENFTAAEKSKLAGLEGSHYRGTFVNLAALQAAIPAAQEGDYADVDAGASAPVQRYIWDESDSEWVAQAGSADPVTAAQVKTLYESNPDTNAYTDAEKSKLAGVAAGATANANTDSLAEGATNLYHTAARVLATVLSGLSLATGTAITSSDSVLVAFGKLQKQIIDLITTVSGKQDTLVSGTSIKTINGESVLGSGNIAISGGGAVSSVNGRTGAVQVLVPIIIACSDESTALTAGPAKVTFRMPYAFTVTGVLASLTTAQAGGSILTVDINEAGVSILSTKLTIDNTEKTSATAATAPVISDSAIAADAEITIDIDQIGDGSAKGLKVTLVGYQP